MTNATLVAHRGTRRVAEAIVRAEAAPAFTDTWHPYPHSQVLDALGLAVKEAGLTIERKEYSLSPGALMFGVWEVNRGTDELHFAIGIRNSINKTMAVGLCAGERVFVCDNMVFSSEFVLFRKHTSGLDEDEVGFMAREALGAVMPQWDRIREWHDGLKNVELNVREASFLTIAAMRQGLINPKEFDRWNDLYFGNGTPTKYTPTLHGWHGATTELLNPIVFYRNAPKQARLNAFINHEVPLLLSQASEKKSFTFEAAEAEAAETATKARAEAKVDNRKVAQEFRAKVAQARREKKAEGKAKRERKPVAIAREKERERVHVEAVKARAKKAAKAKHTTESGGSIGLDGSVNIHGPKPRRTARVKAREAIAKQAPVIKTKTCKAPKGEKVKTGKAVTKAIKAADLDDDDILFCSRCDGEFPASQIKKVGDDRLCPKCLAKGKKG